MELDELKATSSSLSVHMLCTEKRLHESSQALVEHAQRVAKIQFRAQAVRPTNRPLCKM